MYKKILMTAKCYYEANQTMKNIFYSIKHEELDTTNFRVKNFVNTTPWTKLIKIMHLDWCDFFACFTSNYQAFCSLFKVRRHVIGCINH